MLLLLVKIFETFIHNVLKDFFTFSSLLKHTLTNWQQCRISVLFFTVKWKWQQNKHLLFLCRWSYTGLVYTFPVCFLFVISQSLKNVHLMFCDNKYIFFDIHRYLSVLTIQITFYVNNSTQTVTLVCYVDLGCIKRHIWNMCFVYWWK